MTKRMSNSERQALEDKELLDEANAQMKAVFDKYSPTDVDRLFDILKLIAIETRQMAAHALESSSTPLYCLPRSYRAELYEERKVFSSHFFIDGDIDEPISESSDEFIGFGFEPDGALPFVRVWYEKIYKYSESSCPLHEYITNVVRAIDWFEGIKNDIALFNTSLEKAIKARDADLSVAQSIGKGLSKEDRSALGRLGINMPSP